MGKVQCLLNAPLHHRSMVALAHKLWHRPPSSLDVYLHVEVPLCSLNNEEEHYSSNSSSYLPFNIIFSLQGPVCDVKLICNTFSMFAEVAHALIGF